MASLARSASLNNITVYQEQGFPPAEAMHEEPRRGFSRFGRGASCRKPFEDITNLPLRRANTHSMSTGWVHEVDERSPTERAQDRMESPPPVVMVRRSEAKTCVSPVAANAAAVREPRFKDTTPVRMWDPCVTVSHGLSLLSISKESVGSEPDLVEIFSSEQNPHASSQGELRDADTPRDEKCFQMDEN